jgi:curved DNA-binding protein
MSKAPDAEARFKDAAEAYATLKDPEKRAAYDQLGQRPAGEDFAPPPQWQHDFASGPQSFDDMDLSDLLAAMGRGQRGGMHGGPRNTRPMHGRDYETSVNVSLAQAHQGTKVNLDLDDGEGGRTLEVTVPAGVSEGQKLRLRGKGGKGHQGGQDGDIYLHIHLTPHPVFRADHHDLYFDLALTPWEAALGADIEVPTLDAPVVLTVAPLTRPGRKLRLRGRGLANGQGGRGDLFATVRIDLPATLTDQERELYRELGRISTFNPRAVPAKETTHETT